jgi:hypothetical protein
MLESGFGVINGFNEVVFIALAPDKKAEVLAFF